VEGKQEIEDGLIFNQFHIYAEKEKKRLQRVLTEAGYYPTKIQSLLGTGHLAIETRFATQADLDRIKADV
jgi:hypothetical protein